MQMRKAWLANIERTPPPKTSRLHALRYDKNEFLKGWHDDLYAVFLSRFSTEHLTVLPELGNVYTLLAKYTGLSEKSLLVGAGSDACIHAAFDAFVVPQSTVIIPSPTFLMYDIYARAAGASVVHIGYERDFSIVPEKIIAAMGTHISLICLPNPGSPIGSVLPQDALHAIVQSALSFEVPVLIDEAYYPFYTQTMLPSVLKYPNLLVTRTLSKAAGLAGARVGFVAGNETLLAQMRAFKPMYEISFPSVLLAEIIVEHSEYIEDYAQKVRESKLELAKVFDKMGFKTYAGFANFMLVDFGIKREAIIACLDTEGVLYKSSFHYPVLKGWSRFSVGPWEHMQPLINILHDCDKGK